MTHLPIVTLRDFRPGEEAEINALSLRAYQEYQDQFPDWAEFREHVARMASMLDIASIFVAEVGGSLAGVVALVPPGGVRSPEFDLEWAVLRMLSVDPAFRGQGIGRALTQHCIDVARANGWSKIALHTSPIMLIALPLYLRMGFVRDRDMAPISGVPYAIYVKDLTTGLEVRE